MSKSLPFGHLAVPFIHIPSKPMVIRRYRSLNERNLRTFFNDGLFCRNVPTFDDDNEGLVEQAVENPAMRAGAVVTANNSRRRRGLPKLDLDPEEFREIMTELHELSRKKYFANCWRLGTSECERVWKNYTGDEDMIEGFAFETTVEGIVRALPTSEDAEGTGELETNGVDPSQTPVEQMYVGQPSTDIHIGAVRYQERKMPQAVQPAGYQSSVNFFKGSSFDYELEFRFLFNPYDSANLIRFDMDGRPVSPLPDTIPEYQYFPVDTKQMVDRIVLAPNAGKEQRKRIENILDELDVQYGTTQGDDLEIVESNSGEPPLNQRLSYTADFSGTDNYDGSPQYLNDEREKFVEQSDADCWPVLDLVEISHEKAGTVIENYRYADCAPEIAIDDFGHDGYQAVIVNRVFANGDSQEYMNDKAEERFGGSDDNPDE